MSAPAERKGRGCFGCLTLLVILGVLGAAGLWLWKQQGRGPDLATDDDAVERMYGPPPFFTIIFARDTLDQPAQAVRREVWAYPDRRIVFSFVQGSFTYTSDHAAPPGGRGPKAAPLRKERITPTLTEAELSKLLGRGPAASVPLPERELPGAIRHDYGDGISAVFQRGALLMFQALPPH